MADQTCEPAKGEGGNRAEALCQHLRKAATLVDSAIDRMLVPHGLTARQYELMRALASNPNINQMGLSQLTNIDRSTMTEMITRLVGRAIIHRARNPQDARSYLVRLTDGGRERLAQVQPLVGEVQRSVWQSLDPDMVDALERALTALIGPLEIEDANRGCTHANT